VDGSVSGIGRRLAQKAAARVRRSLGVEDLSARLAALERRPTDGYPRGPVYFGDHTALVPTRWGAKMLVHTQDAAISPWLALDGLWEAHVTAWLQRTLQPGQVFVDVGANVGYFTLLAAQLVGPQGRVIAVEAHPRLAEILHRNVVINGVYGHVTTWQRAAWSTHADLKFHTRVNFAGNSSAGSVGDEALTRLGDTEEIIEVQAVPLDDLLADLSRVDVLKVDIEGAEVHAFTGLARTLAANPDVVVMFEWAPAQIQSVGDRPEALVDLLEGYGFRFQLLEDGLQPVSRDGLLGLPYGNVVATR
jgi:FkbM family methyltransferase